MGRDRPGPESTLTADYLARATAAGRPLGFGAVTLKALETKGGKTGAAAEAEVLQAAIPPQAVRIILDERGQTLTSVQLAARLGHYRDSGVRDLAFVIGGADGHDPALRDTADLLLGLGAMTWPHMLVRAMVAEQIYRAFGILAGSPYHRA